MIIRWGRKSLFAGAFAFTFIAAPSSVNTVQAYPLTDQVHGQFHYQHIASPTAAANTLKPYQYWGDQWRFNYHYLTPVEIEIEDITPEAYSGGYFDYEALRLPRRRFEAETEEEREAKSVLEDINEQLQTPGVETRTDLEIVLRMRLRLQGIRYQELYMEWLEQGLEQKKAAIKRKRRNKAITLLLLQ